MNFDLDFAIKLENVPFSFATVGSGKMGHVPPHAHSAASYELHFIESGKGTLLLPEQQWPLQAGSFFLTGPGVWHEQCPDPACPMVETGLYYTVPLSAAQHPEVFSPLLASLLRQRFWLGPCPASVQAALQSLYTERMQKQPGWQSLTPLLAGQLLIALARTYTTAAQPESPRRAFAEESRFLQIERYFLGSPVDLSLPGLAAQLGLSVRQVQRLLKRQYGVTFEQMLLRARLNAAFHMLQETQLPLSTVAERAGFSTLDYCERCFRRSVGVSPRQYRAMHRREPHVLP